MDKLTLIILFFLLQLFTYFYIKDLKFNIIINVLAISFYIFYYFVFSFYNAYVVSMMIFFLVSMIIIKKYGQLSGLIFNLVIMIYVFIYPAHLLIFMSTINRLFFGYWE